MTTARSIQPSRNAHAALSRLLALACAVAVVLVAPLARAAAPMCGDEGTSVAAPPPVLPIDGGRATATPHCADDDPGNFVAQAPPAQHVPVASAAPTPDRVLPWGHASLVCPRSAVLEMPRTRDGSVRPGYRTAVFRPPRAL